MYENKPISLADRISRFRRGSYVVGYNVDAGESPYDVRKCDIEALANAFVADLELQENWKFCPDCPVVMGKSLFANRQTCRTGVKMELSDRNYSGTGVDMYNCPKCGKGFAVSYKVASVVREPNWDVDVESTQ